ncbi:MAG: ArsR family transcriptional regulator [Halobacteriovoraceae bacterium]|jgi:DNA-binding transcriptional regulator GbsR (MarR family)|nr:ArsR family transcriptional regulator [Halobacteriovoraceae bacterium]
MNNEVDLPIEKELLEEIHIFEVFLNKIGFKRIEGAIYGLLVLAKRPLNSEEIEKTLGLSQSAVSQSIKVLNHYGAIESKSDATQPRLKFHSAKEDSLSIVSTVFRKREQEIIEEFRKMAQRVLRNSSPANLERVSRLKSIISTCEIAESVMNFVLNVSKLELPSDYSAVVRRLPKALDFLSASTLAAKEPLAQMTNNLKSNIKNQLSRLTGDHL